MDQIILGKQFKHMKNTVNMILKIMQSAQEKSDMTLEENIFCPHLF